MVISQAARGVPSTLAILDSPVPSRIGESFCAKVLVRDCHSLHWTPRHSSKYRGVLHSGGCER